jgi:hypothetical protein
MEHKELKSQAFCIVFDSVTSSKPFSLHTANDPMHAIHKKRFGAILGRGRPCDAVGHSRSIGTTKLMSWRAVNASSFLYIKKGQVKTIVRTAPYQGQVYSHTANSFL